MKIEQVPIGDLLPFPGNPRFMSKHDAEALKRSLREFGAVDPAIVNADNTLVGGNMRVLAAQELGWETFPIVRVNLPPEKARLLNLALNRISGEWDDDKLSELLYNLSDEGADVTLSGFEPAELEKLLLGVAGDWRDPGQGQLDRSTPQTCPDCGRALRCECGYGAPAP